MTQWHRRHGRAAQLLYDTFPFVLFALWGKHVCFTFMTWRPSR